MENNTVIVENEKSLPLLKILLKNVVMIILVTVLCALLGLGYCVLRVPPTYTASCSLILRTEISKGGTTSQVANQATLAKRYFYTVEKLIKSPDLLDEVNEAYTTEGQEVSKGAIGITYGEKSLIFSITYTDLSAELAEEKLDILIKTFSDPECSVVQQGIMADGVQFVRTQKGAEITAHTSYVKYALLGAVVGVVVSVAIALLVYALDNTVRDKKEFEELTGVSVIAYINKDKPKKN